MWQDIKNIYHWFRSYLASVYFGFPSKKLIVIGITGTDGKTTTTNMIYQILKKAGKKVAMISSVNAQIGGETLDTGFHVTTPNAWDVQRLLKKAVKAGQKYFILETTSHGLHQNRIANINFEIAVVTNVTHEHLDYHGNWENYAKAKAKLLERAKISVLNIDDLSYGTLKKYPKGKVLTYSQSMKADFTLKEFPLVLKIPGHYNLSNALAAAVVASELGIEKSEILESLKNFSGVPGRMEEINLGQDFKVFIDFAHTPNSLENALKSLASDIKDPKSKLIAVFGAAGERDKQKRPKMGEIAGKLADISVITAEDPRSEKVENISAEIAKGFNKVGKKEGKDFFRVNDRLQAIQFAIDKAKAGDIVATFGKSHEKSMCFGKTEYLWDEFTAVEEAIRKRLRAKV